MKKGFSPIFLIVGLVFVLAIVGGLYYFANNSSSSTASNPVARVQTTPSPASVLNTAANWKTYTSPNKSFSFKYPNTWQDLRAGEAGGPTFGQTGTSPLSIVTNTFPTGTLCGIECENPSLQDFLNISNKTFWHVGDIGGGGSGTTFNPAQLATVGGKQSVVRSSHATKDFEQTKTFDITTEYFIPLASFPQEVLHIAFSYNNTSPQQAEIASIIQKILSTFKFAN